MLQAGLERHGFQVWLAANGREAIDKYRQYGEAIAVVLLDVRGPGRDGLQTLEALRRRGADVLACFLSGDTGDYAPQDLLRRGARYIFVKPLCLDDMANVLRLLAHGVPANLLPPCTATAGCAREGCAS
jgi:DNA-binding response OmpR family regulator